MSQVTLDISTLVMLLINVVALVGAFYTLKSDIAGVKKDIERVVSDLGDIKKKQRNAATNLTMWSRMLLCLQVIRAARRRR